MDLSVSSSGEKFLTTGGDQSLILWDTLTGNALQQFEGQGSYMFDLEFLPTESLALATTQKRTIIVWDVENAVPIREYITYDRPSNSGIDSSPVLAVHPSGDSVLTSEPNFSIIKWRLKNPTSSELIEWIETNRLLRELTCLERETYQIQPLCTKGIPQESTAEILSQVASTTVRFDSTFQTEDAQKEPIQINFDEPNITTQAASIGENRGELEKGQLDIWTFEAEEGDVFYIHLIADSPFFETSEFVSLEEKFDSDTLDTVMFVTDSDGTLLVKSDNSIDKDGLTISDAKIEAFVIPQNGTYRIEARSYLDGNSGGYTLFLEKVEPVIIDPTILEAYVGHYIEGPWQFNNHLFLEDGELKGLIEETNEIYSLLPKNETEFVVSLDGSIFVFTRDELGQVDGYDLFLSPIHPPGGKWYRADRVDE